MLAQAYSLVQECKPGHQVEVQSPTHPGGHARPTIRPTIQQAGYICLGLKSPSKSECFLSAASSTALLLALLASDALQTANVLQTRQGSELERELASF